MNPYRDTDWSTLTMGMAGATDVVWFSVLDTGVATGATTWSSLKALYR
jgi:hypothetical protein